MRSLSVVTAVVALLLAASCKGKTDEPMDQIHDFHEHARADILPAVVNLHKGSIWGSAIKQIVHN